jgi:hypothetical protein
MRAAPLLVSSVMDLLSIVLRAAGADDADGFWEGGV